MTENWRNKYTNLLDLHYQTLERIFGAEEFGDAINIAWDALDKKHQDNIIETYHGDLMRRLHKV